MDIVSDIPAGARVATSVHLMSLIWVHLDVQTCFRARGVCRGWRTMINDMTRLCPPWSDALFARWYTELTWMPWPPPLELQRPCTLPAGIPMLCHCGEHLFTLACRKCFLHRCKCIAPSAAGRELLCPRVSCAWFMTAMDHYDWCVCLDPDCMQHPRFFISLPLSFFERENRCRGQWEATKKWISK